MCGEDRDIFRMALISTDVATIFCWIYFVMVLHKNKHKTIFIKRGTILLQAYVYVSLFHVAICEPVVLIFSTDCVTPPIMQAIRIRCFGNFRKGNPAGFREFHAF